MTKPQITLPQLTFRELLRPPAKSGDGQATLYLDRATSALLISVDGYDYVALDANGPLLKFTTVENISYASSIVLDFSGPRMINLGILTGDVSFDGLNMISGASITIRMKADSTDRNLTFPGWNFFGSAAPTILPAGKIGILALQSWGTLVTDVDAVWVESV